MSCLKLSYNEKDECLEQLVIFYGGAYEKSATAVKFCTNYYPFGLQHSTSWTRISDLKNNFLYNAGAELNEQTKNYEMFYRHYDPALGRMNGIDPVAAKYSSLTPYNYSFNDPITFNDPMGDDPNRERREFDGENWEQWMGFFRDENPHHWHRGYFTEGGGFSVIENKVLTYDPAARISQGIFGAFNNFASGGLSIQIGNLNLNWNSLGNGVHNFGFDNGEVTSYSQGSVQSIVNMQGYTMNQYRPLYGNRAGTRFYRKDADGNRVLAYGGQMPERDQGSDVINFQPPGFFDNIAQGFEELGGMYSDLGSDMNGGGNLTKILSAQEQLCRIKQSMITAI